MPQTSAEDPPATPNFIVDSPAAADALNSHGRVAAALHEVITRAERVKRCCQSNGNLSPVGRSLPYPGLALAHEGLATQPGRLSVVGLVGLSADEVAFLVEVVVEGAVDGGELLEGLHLPEPQHRPLSSSERLV